MAVHKYTPISERHPMVSFIFNTEEEMLAATYDALDTGSAIKVGTQAIYMLSEVDGTGAGTFITIGGFDDSSVIINGGTIAWTVGYTFTVSSCSYRIAGRVYSSPVTNIVLDASDITDDRIDIIVVDTLGVVSAITGTPDAVPIQPLPDEATQLLLGSIYVKAGSTSPDFVTNTPIFDEGTEWSASSSAGTFNLTSTADPYTGTISIEATNCVNTDKVVFISPVPVVITDANNIIIALKLKTAISSAYTLYCQFKNGATNVGRVKSITRPVYGYNRDNTTAYQLIIVPINAFAFAPSTVVDRLIIGVRVMSGNPAWPGFFIDAIRLQAGVPGHTASDYMTFVGAWSALKYYDTNNVVTIDGASYVAIASSIDKTPPNTTYWQSLSTGIADTDALPEGSTNLYHTVSRVYSAIVSSWTAAAGAIADGDTLQQVLQKLAGNLAASILSLGESSSTAYRGDRGKVAYDHSQATSGNPHGVTKADVGLSSVPDVDCTNAANISSGVLDIARIPPSALERLYKYTGAATEPESMGLTTGQVQNGDTIKVVNGSNASDGLMWMVLDDANLNLAASFEPYTAGSASAVPWSGVTSKPVNLTDIAALAVTLGSAIVGNGTSFVLQALGNAASKNVGTGSGDVAAGDKGLPSVGSDGQVLTVVSGTWQSAASSGSSGGDTLVSEGALIASATDKATPVDTDYVGLMDSAASDILKKLSWANIKATLKTYFDTLYPAIARGLPSGGTTGQVLTKSSGTDYDAAWNTPSGGGGSLETSCFKWDYLYASSTRLTISSITTIYQGISGSSVATDRLTLPVGVYLVDVWYEQVIAGRLNDVITFKKKSGGTLSVTYAIATQAGTAAATGTTTTNAFQKLKLTITGSAVAGWICGTTTNDEIAIASGTASTQALVVATFTKVS